jgi:hypothetical protein
MIAVMRFWELVSFLRSEPSALQHLGDRPEWSVFADWQRNFTALVRRQDRSSLDTELSDDLCRHILSFSSQRFEVIDGHLRASEGGRFSALNVYDRYGGWILEEVSEFGSANAEIHRPPDR